MRIRERRHLDANAQINLCAVRGVLGVCFIVAAGTFFLAWFEKPVPEWTGNLLSTITGGLIGYLARDPKHPPGMTVETAETVNVEAQEPNTAETIREQIKALQERLKEFEGTTEKGQADNDG
jgi:hypothetical protein